MLMDGLYVATGFFGALTLIWLARRVAGLLSPAPSADAYFGTAADAAVADEIGKAKREVLLLGEAGPDVFAALEAAHGRKVAIDVLLAPDAEHPPFDREKLQAREASRATTGLLAVVDDRAVIVGVSGQVVVVRGYLDVVQTCRQRFAAHHPVSRPAAPPPPAPVVTLPAEQPRPAPVVSLPAEAPPPAPVVSLPAKAPPAPVVSLPAEPPAPVPAPAPAAAPTVIPAPTLRPVPATSPVDDLLAAVARGPAAPPRQEAEETEEEEEEEDEQPVNRATADLFARFRKEAAEAAPATQDDSSEEAA